MVQIVPSLLSANFANLEQQIHLVETAGAKRLHIDVMDGHFVPNITIGPLVVSAIRKITTLHLETHLMIENPENYIPQFVSAGSDTVIIHVETTKDIPGELKRIRSLGARAGLVINPPTPFTSVEPFLSMINHLLIMTVNPGFGGQKMIQSALEKVRLAKSAAQKYGFPIEIDGGVNLVTLASAVSAGTDLLVAGNAVFGESDPALAFMDLERRANA
ncbi:MAG: ribulose-phosphate 3-epimerase [Candidatus Marinimicrobia bacterium]|jgi:ribulose-phosphate 3-epimerase|nr:ribulose-phosphate 3-epimerase [Candidatus Neomarinimicrobiota bacterium]